MHVDYVPVSFFLHNLQCLNSESWLNSETINSYVAIVQRKVRSARVHIADSHLMTKVLNDKLANFKTWVRGMLKSNQVKSIDELDRLCMPYNIRNTHWAAICCDFVSSTITLMDSLPDYDHENALSRLKLFLEHYCTKKPKLLWSIVVRTDLAFRQTNAYDCGLFAIAHVTLCALKQENMLGVCSQGNVIHMRERVYHDLVMNEIKFEDYMCYFAARSKSTAA